MTTVSSTTIGYPYIGENREWKRTVEQFWNQQLSESQFEKELKNQRIANLLKQQDKGIEQITVGDFTYYDRMLDLAFMFRLIPERYHTLESEPSLKTYYAMARGSDTTIACEMTKWFNTNYHYIVPEYEQQKLSLGHNYLLDLFNEAKSVLSTTPKPTFIGPYSFIQLTKGYCEKTVASFILQLLPLYEQVIQQLVDAGAEWIQLEEPMFTQELDEEQLQLIDVIYQQLADHVPGANLMISTYFEAIPQYERIVQLPVAGIGLDFVHGYKDNLQAIKQYSFPGNKVLAAGIINGRDIWVSPLKEVTQKVEAILQLVSPKALWLQPSCNLQHSPVTTAAEKALPTVLYNALAFADEKLDELRHITYYIRNQSFETPSIIKENLMVIEKLATDVSRNNSTVAQEIKQLNKKDFNRSQLFEERIITQKNRLHLPDFPTTTIGSFPQSEKIKKIRSQWRKKEISTELYETQLRAETNRWIKIQEDLDLDVLVHGEFERTDMVEYFGEKLAGFAFTKKAWVVSYGSRCVKPPIIYGDIEWLEPMTVKETTDAQEQTDRLVKGMLTGPVTILNWSFVRDDIERSKVAIQIALALKKEILALEKSGIQIIQVDEPALREGLPLRQSRQQDYLDWSINAFKLATAAVQPSTQIHTHMCYCEFNDFIEPIIALDADVISLETSRSHGELIHSLQHTPYPYGIGLGVYDIHSPRVPSIEEMYTILEDSLNIIPKERFWINPDCGLKTRREKETVDALKNMVSAAKQLRSQIKKQPISF